MRYKRGLSIPVLVVIVIAVSFLLTSCLHLKEISIQPAEPERADVGLGPGVRPLSSGPGDKSSPSWSPSGKRIAFIVDGYVVDKPLNTQDFRRWTTKDFGAEKVVWISAGRRLAIFDTGSSTASTSPPSEAAAAAGTVYRASPGEESLDVTSIAEGVQALFTGPQKKDLVLAVATGTSESGLTLIRGNEVGGRLYTGSIPGDVTGASISPDGSRAALAVRKPGTPESYELHVFKFSAGESRQIARLDEGQRILGAPQFTEQGIYYVAGKESEEAEGDASLYDLYRITAGSKTPEPAPGVGEEFVASSILRSPEGNRLAVIGRRNPSSPANLYILDPDEQNLKAATSNEDMDIKTGPDDLSWSADGKSVVIIARVTQSGPKVYEAPVRTLVADFYNLYEVPVAEPDGAGAG